MTQQIHIIHGSTGEWSDRVEWTIEAWRSEAAAKDRVVALTQRARELAAEEPPRPDEDADDDAYGPEHPIQVARAAWYEKCDAEGVGSDPEETRFFLSSVPLKP